jgi:hypothetical protein
MYACLYVCIYVSVYVCVYVCMYVCMCMCVSDLDNNRFACNSDVYVSLGLSYTQPNILHQRAMDDPFWGVLIFGGLKILFWGRVRVRGDLEGLDRPSFFSLLLDLPLQTHRHTDTHT